MKILTREKYNEQKAKTEKIKAKLAVAEADVKTWEQAEKQNPVPTGYEIIAFKIEKDGVFPLMRKKTEESKAKA